MPYYNRTKTAVEVPFYTVQGSKLVCGICPRNCKLGVGQSGICRGRKNIDGRLIAVNYGKSASVAVDPIEKKPLYHFYPGTNILSTGPNSCNLTCKFCQNFEISQFSVPTRSVNPGELTEIAKKRNSIGIAYTYSEPLMWYEFLLDCCAEFHKAGMVNVLVTNGYINPEPFAKLIPLVDAMNVDLKSMDNEFYRKLCGGVKLQPVLQTIETAYNAGIHIEITQLLITGANDSVEQIKKTVDWVSSLGKDIPLHFSRYFPRHKYKAPATAPEVIHKAYEIAKEKLEWVYIGNMSSNKGQDSVCPDCGNTLVKRSGYSTSVKGLEENKCGKCGRRVNFRI